MSESIARSNETRAMAHESGENDRKELRDRKVKKSVRICERNIQGRGSTNLLEEEDAGERWGKTKIERQLMRDDEEETNNEMRKGQVTPCLLSIGRLARNVRDSGRRGLGEL